MITVGVLALQGAISEHLNCLNSLPQVKGVLVKKSEDFSNIDGLILPGGESTTMGKLLREFDLSDMLADKIKSGLPVWGTCAGMILLAKNIADQDSSHLGLMNIFVRRNAYGSQLDSFTTNLLIPAVASSPLPLVFIRAPYVEEVESTVRVLATVDNKIVAVEEANMLATAFHPELTKNLAFHQYFANKVKAIA